MARPFQPIRRTNDPRVPRQLDRAELDRLVQTVEKHDRPTVSGNLGTRTWGGATSTLDLTPWAGWVKITGNVGTTYNFVELYTTGIGGAGATGTQTEGRTGTGTTNPLYEINGYSGTLTDQIVWAWTGADWESFYFWYPGSGPITFTGDVTFSGSTVNMKPTTFNVGNSAAPGTTTNFYGPTINIGSTSPSAPVTTNYVNGSLIFPSTTLANTAPTAVLILPTLTATQPAIPTWTGTPGEIICAGNYLYQYTTTNTVITYTSTKYTDITALTLATDTRVPVWNPTTNQYELPTLIRANLTNLTVGINQTPSTTTTFAITSTLATITPLTVTTANNPSVLTFGITVTGTPTANIIDVNNGVTTLFGLDDTYKLLLHGSTTAGASLNLPSGTAPSTPANGDLWYDGTHVYFYNGVTNTDLLATGFVDPMTTLGDLIYENASPAPARLAGNITTTQKFLTQTGTGAVSAAPAWNAITTADLPATVAVWTKYTKTYTDFSDPGNSKSLALVTLSDSQILHAIAINCPTGWAGGTIASGSAQVGITGNNGKFTSSYSVTPAGLPGYRTSVDESGGALPTTGKTLGAALNATVSVVGDTLDHATAGELDVWLLVSTLP